jgi:hypothetical protein
MFSKTRLPKLIGLHLRLVRGEWVAQKICPSRIFAFADLSGPMLSGNRHQVRGAPCGELTRRDQIALELAGSEPVVGGMTGFGVADQPKKTGFGAALGSGFNF